MGEKHSFVKGGAIGLQSRGGRDAAYRLKSFMLRAGKGEGHQSCIGFGHRKAELLGEAEGKVSGPHLWDGLATAGDHEITRCDRARPMRVAELDRVTTFNLCDGLHRGVELDLPAGLGHAFEKHGDNLLGGGVTKQLPQCFLVIGNTAACHPIDEIPLRVAGQCGFGEMWIAADIILR